MTRSQCCLVLVGVLLAGGCGTEQYEQRLTETDAFFQYRQSLDRALQAYWEERSYTIKMRVPKGFNRLPRPAVPKEGEPAPVETRQPTAFNELVLPGLVEAWRGDFACDDGKVWPTLMYVCSNHSLFHPAEGVEGLPAEAFNHTIEELVASAMGVSLPEAISTKVEDNVRYRELCPRDPKRARYTTQKPFDAMTIVPQAGYANDKVEFTPKCQLYTHSNGPIQVAVLLIYPGNTRERLDMHLMTALETFSVSNQIPKPVRAGVPATGTPDGPKF